MVNKKKICCAVILAVLILASSLSARLLFDKPEYAARRAKLMEKIPDGIAIIRGAQPLTGYYNYFQNNDFMYLCGVEVPDAVLIIDGIRKESLLLFTATERSLRNEGMSTDILKNPTDVTGIERVMPIEELNPVLTRLASQSKVIYTPFKPE
jgi:Xaa-Pro aminopeptidase